MPHLPSDKLVRQSSTAVPTETLKRLSVLTGIPLCSDGAEESFFEVVRERRRVEFLQYLARCIAQKLRDIKGKER